MNCSSGIQLPELVTPTLHEHVTAAGDTSHRSAQVCDGQEAPGTRGGGHLAARAELRRSIRNAASPMSIRNHVAAFLRQQPQTVFAAWFEAAEPGIGSQDALDGLLAPESGVSQTVIAALKGAARSACQQDRTVTESLTSGTLQIVAVPLGGQRPEAIVAITDSGTPADHGFHSLSAQLEWIAALVSEHIARRASNESCAMAQASAAIADLTSRIQATADPAVGAQTLADSLQRHLQPDEVRIGLCHLGSLDCRLVAISGGRVIDRLAADTRDTESVMQESLLRGQAGEWPARDPDNRHALLAHQQLTEQSGCRSLQSMPLRADDGTPVGCILLVFHQFAGGGDSVTPDASPATDPAVLAGRFLSAAARPLACTLSLLQKSTEFRWLQALLRMRTALTKSQLQNGLVITAALAILMLLPVTYKVSGAVELQPASRRFVAAPFDASLAECLVEPGDVVQKNQVLVRLDGREIQVELAEAIANLNKAVRERNAHAARHEYAAASITAEEIRRFEQQIELLKLHEAGLEVRSPVNGVVVNGDHREACGVPLKTGQTLFEIASLDQMVIELSIPEDDLQHVQPGMPLSVQLDAYPAGRYEARVRRVHPRTEIRDHENVFIGEADIENVEGLLKPGMRGHGWISTRRHFWGWNLLHKPVARITGWLGW